MECYLGWKRNEAKKVESSDNPQFNKEVVVSSAKYRTYATVQNGGFEELRRRPEAAEFES
jgi:hypothetical protein